MKDGLDLIKEGLASDRSGNFLVFVIFVIFSCIWGSFYLLSIRIDENKASIKTHGSEHKAEHKENAKAIQLIREVLAERKAYIYKNVSDK